MAEVFPGITLRETSRLSALYAKVAAFFAGWVGEIALFLSLAKVAAEEELATATLLGNADEGEGNRPCVHKTRKVTLATTAYSFLVALQVTGAYAGPYFRQSFQFENRRYIKLRKRDNGNALPPSLNAPYPVVRKMSCPVAATCVYTPE